MFLQNNKSGFHVKWLILISQIKKLQICIIDTIAQFEFRRKFLQIKKTSSKEEDSGKVCNMLIAFPR